MFGCLVVVVVARAFAGTSGPRRRARLPALVGALAFGVALTAASVVTITDSGPAAGRDALWAYEP